MSWIGRLFGYDEKNEPDRCGVGPVSTDEHDPYFDACAWHDRATLEGSPQSKYMSVRAINKAFRRQMRELKGVAVSACYRAKDGTVDRCEALRARLNRRRQLYGNISSALTRFFAKDPPKK